MDGCAGTTMRWRSQATRQLPITSLPTRTPPASCCRRGVACSCVSRTTRPRLTRCSSRSIWSTHASHQCSSGKENGMNLTYADGIGAALTTLALEGNAAALKLRLPSGWELTPFEGSDVRERALQGATMLVVFHEVYAVRTHDGHPVGLPQVSYIAFASRARNTSTGALALIHWCTYTEDPARVPGKFKDGRLAHVTRQQTFTKQKRGETHVRETFSAVADTGAVDLSLAYHQGGFVLWLTAD